MRCGRFQLLFNVLPFVINIIVFGLLYYNIAPPPLPLPSPPKTIQKEFLPTYYTTTSSKENLGNSNYLLVILILSSLTPSGKERRDAIRQTWMKSYVENQDVLIKFAVGTEGLSYADKEVVIAEEIEHRDLLFLPNLKESYSNLTRKVLSSFVALESQYRFSYLMKCDDDTFVMVKEVLRELAQRTSRESFYWGFFDGRAHVKRQGKWTEKEWFLCDRYLPYALGGGYILSHDLVRRITTNSDGLVFYNSEDVSVGVWLSPYEAERRHDIRFNTEFVSRGCRNSYLVSHKQSTVDMHSKQLSLEKRGVQCEREYQTRMSYVYDWNVEPTKCCERRKDVI